VRILRQAQDLRECSILFPDHFNNGHGELIRLLALHRLQVDDSTFLDLLVAPAVTELLVNRNVDPILLFLRRSGAQLTSLTIFNWEPSPDLIPILGSCPTLTHLCLSLARSLQNADTLNPVLDALGDADLCPELTSIFWRDEAGPTAMPDVFVDYQDALHGMIASRRRGRLASLHVFLEIAYPSEPRVQRFRSPEYEGFDVRVSGKWDRPSFLEAVNPP